MFSKSIILFQTIETVELDDHRNFLKRYKDIGQKLWNTVKNGKCGQIMFFCSHISICSKLNWNQFGIFCSNVSFIFPNRTGVGSEKLSTNSCQKCQTELESVRKKFSKFLGFFSEPNWNRFGNGHWIKCSCSALCTMHCQVCSHFFDEQNLAETNRPVSSIYEHHSVLYLYLYVC